MFWGSPPPLHTHTHTHNVSHRQVVYIVLQFIPVPCVPNPRRTHRIGSYIYSNKALDLHKFFRNWDFLHQKKKKFDKRWWPTYDGHLRWQKSPNWCSQSDYGQVILVCIAQDNLNDTGCELWCYLIELSTQCSINASSCRWLLNVPNLHYCINVSSIPILWVHKGSICQMAPLCSKTMRKHTYFLSA